MTPGVPLVILVGMPRRLALLLAGLALLASAPAAAERGGGADLDLEELAECVSDSGAVYYGAWWCPQCRRQNELFGDHADDLPYFECYDGPRSGGMNDDCRRAGVRGFPTWVLPDGSELRGRQSPARLAAATDCL